MRIEVFTKRGCPECARLKAKLQDAGMEVVEHDVETPDGLSHLAYYELIPLGQRFGCPIVVIHGEEARRLYGPGVVDDTMEALGCQ